MRRNNEKTIHFQSISKSWSCLIFRYTYLRIVLGLGRRCLWFHLFALAPFLALSILRNCLAQNWHNFALDLRQKLIIFLCCLLDLCFRFTDFLRIRFRRPYAILGLGTLLGFNAGVVGGLLVASASVELAFHLFLILRQILLRIANKLMILYKNLIL